MSINTNSFENYKNIVESSEKGGFLSKLKSFGTDSLGGIDSFMGKDIINANKLIKSFKGFNFPDILSNLVGFLKNFSLSALDILKDMGMDTLRQLQNASINFTSNLVEDLYNNVRSMMYIPDNAFSITLQGLYLAGADLAYNKHYIRTSALQRDWSISLKFIDEQYGIDYNVRDYTDLEKDLALCAEHSCVNNLYYIFRKIYDQLEDIKSDIVVTESSLKSYTKPIKGFKSVSYEEIPNCKNLYVQIGEEKIKINKDDEQGIDFIKNHKDMNYYTETIIDYEGLSVGLYQNYNYESAETKNDVESKYNAYLDNVALVKRIEHFMLVYFKSLIVHGYTYLNASSVQKFFSDFDTVLLPKYYGKTDDKYNGKYAFTQNDCLVMMPDYKGNDITKSDMYTQQLSTQRNNEYIAASEARSEASEAAIEALKTKNTAKTASGTGKGIWSEAGYTINSAIESGTAGAIAKIKAFRANAMETVANHQNVTYSANIKNGISKTLQNNSNGLMNRSGNGINAKKDSKIISSMYDRDVVKNYELVGSLSDKLDEIDFLNKDTKYIVLRNKNIKQIYALLANSTIYGNDRMVNDYFYKRCQIKTMNTLNQSLSKVGSILGSSYAVQSLFDLENALDSSAYVYLKKVENYLLNPKEHSYYGMDVTKMFTSGDNMWTQFGDYFKQAYNWDDSISDDPELESIIEKLSEVSNTKSNTSSKSSVSEINPIKDLTPENGANGETYAEILKQLDSENTAKLYVDNVVRFMSEIPMLDLRDILVKYLTAFYKSIKARDYEPDTYFKTLIKSMSGIDGITHYDDLNSKIFNKSTHKSLLANGKFLVSIYALKNSYKYFLEDEKDINKEEITKIYSLVFVMCSADIQMNGTIAGLYKFDKEQLNSLVKRNFFTSINHLKSINDKTKPLIKTAPRYKDNLTKNFKYKFDLRGISGYSLDNNRILYVPENSTGDWNSIGVSNDEEIGSFFCKSNINGDSNGIYRRTYEGTTLNKIDVISNSGTKITDREFFTITFNDHGAVYFGLNDIDTNKNSISETLYVYDQTKNRIIGVSGFTDNPKDYSFKIDASHKLLIITSKKNKGCYYTTLNTTTCSKLSNTGSDHYFVKLGDNSLLVCPKDSKSGIGYFDIDGNYINTCNLPDSVSIITRVKPVTTKAIVNVQQPPNPSDSSTESGESSQPIIIPTSLNVYGVLISTNIGIIHLLAITQVDITTGQLIGSKTLSMGKTYTFTNKNSPCYIYDNMKVIGINDNSKYICKFLESNTPMTITSTSILLTSDLFSFGNEVEISNPSYPLENYDVNYSCNTDDGIYTILTRIGSNTRELYFIPYKNNTEIMYLIRSKMAITVDSVDVLNTINISSSKKPAIIIYPNKSIDFISITTTSSSINLTIVDSYFKDIDDEIPSDDTLVIKQSKYGWENISVPNDNNIYIQNKNYGVILFKNGVSVHKLMNYSKLTSGDITKADLLFDYQIVKAKSITLFANKSSGNKYIKNGYGLFKSTNDGINYQYADTSSYHDGDIGSMVYDKHHNCVYFGTYRDKTIFDYDFLATIAAFDIDAYISQLSYYELSKLAKNLMESSSTTINEGILDLLSSKKEDLSFTYNIDELLTGIIDISLKTQESCQTTLMNSTLFTDLTNYKTATEMFDDVTSENFNDDMTKDFITSYPGDISIENDLFPTVEENFSIGDIIDMDNDGDIDQDDLNWYLALANGGEINTKLSLNDWFNNLANGVYGNGMGSILSLRLSFDKRIKYFATLRANKSHFLISGKSLSSDEANPDVEGPNSIIDPTTDPESSEYKWYHNTDFASKDFENSDENGEFSWQ